MSADRLLMENIHQLVNEEHWNLDGALHEHSNVRHDMVAVMQPRPRQRRSAALVRGGKRQREWTPPPQRGESKRKGDRKGVKEEGKGKGEGKKLVEKLGEVLVLRKDSSDGQTKPICMRYNLSQCTTQKCTFAHCCPVLKSDGSVCGSTDLKPIACLHRSRKVSTWGQLPASEKTGDGGAVARATSRRWCHRGMQNDFKCRHRPRWNRRHGCQQHNRSFQSQSPWHELPASIF